jgi:heat-inducible transcriptional repressor
MDSPTPANLTRRQEEILALIVESYTHKPEPVSSKSLKDTYQLTYSTATIRNEMAALDELGYLTAPHTSAGRVPTQAGYRHFVKRMIDADALPAGERAYIAEKLQISPAAMEQWLRGAARQLARTVSIASLVTPPVAETSRFKHVELIAIQGRLCLMVLVLAGGSVHQQMLNLAEPVPQNTLSDAATHINGLAAGLNAADLRRKGLQLNALERDIIELACSVMEQADGGIRFVYRDGLSDVVGSFHENAGAQQALRILEENAVINTIIGEFVAPLEANDVHVVIGGEGRWEEMSHLTMVLGRYGIPGQASGALGVVGPTYLDYPRAVSAVRYIAELMTTTLQKLYDAPPTDDAPPDAPSKAP